MLNIYWYISKSKIEQLQGDNWKENIAGLSLKVKTPWLEIETSKKEENSLFKDIITIEHKIKEKEGIPFYDETKEKQSIFFYFEGNASRIVDEMGYWVAMAKNQTALLLAGSSSNAVGHSFTHGEKLSPSFNPVGAINSAFTKDNNNVNNLSKSLTYAWQEIIRSNGLESGNLPYVQGIAIFAGLFPVDKSQSRRAGVGNMKEIVVGTPVFIRQIPSPG